MNKNKDSKYMKSILTICFLIAGFTVFGQNIRLKVTGQTDTTVHLVRYYGAKLFYADTAEIKNGVVEFDGSKQKPGMLALLLPGQQMFDFIYNNEEISLETEKPDFIEKMKVRKSEENKLFFEYVRFISARKKKSAALSDSIKQYEEDSKEYTAIREELKSLNDEVVTRQKEIASQHANMLLGKIVKMQIDIDIPDAPVDEAGNITDSSFQLRYYQEHYFDNVDLTDDRLVNTNIFHHRLEGYFTRMIVQHWDTIINHAYNFCDQLAPTSTMFEYCVSWITTNYGKSKIMGMDKVYVMMADKYYCTLNDKGESPAFWMTQEKLDDLCKKIKIQKNLVMGVQPPNLILRDTTDQNWVNLFNVDAEYTILYFWDPECGHCKKITPKLQTLYAEKFKDRGIEIYAVGKAVGEDFDKWKEFIRKNNLEFINVGLTETLFEAAQKDARQFVPKYTNIESLNYQTTYDIFSTPRVFVLNKDKEIIAKQLSISQLEDLMDRLQEKTDLPKLFPPDEDGEDQMH